MNDLLDKEFLEKNYFVQDKIGCGYFPWRYEDKTCAIVVATRTDTCSCFVYATNHSTHETITLEHRAMDKLSKNDFKRVMEFLNINLYFDYE